MDWQLIVALMIAVPIILFPVALIWYLNFGGFYAAVRERKLHVVSPLVKVIRIVLAILTPVAIYALTVWFFFGNFSWQVALAVALVLPIVLVVPVLIWAAVVSGLYQVARDSLRRRAAAPRRQVAVAEERIVR